MGFAYEFAEFRSKRLTVPSHFRDAVPDGGGGRGGAVFGFGARKDVEGGFRAPSETQRDSRASERNGELHALRRRTVHI